MSGARCDCAGAPVGDPAGVVSALRRAGLTVAAGESITAGLVSATLAEVPGCSAVLRGGVVAYQADVKAHLLGVPQDVLDRGLVTSEVAEAMALGAARALGADVGIGTTGAAGPDPHDGVPPGTVWVAVAVGTSCTSTRLQVEGDRAAVRRAAVEACWELLTAALSGRDSAAAPAAPRE